MAKKQNTTNKKEKVLSKKKPNYVLIGTIAAIIVIVAGVLIFSGTKNTTNVGGDTQNVGSQDYAGQNIQMTDLKAEVANGKLSVSLDEIKKARIVRFEDPEATLKLQNGEVVPLPLVAYVSTKGDIKVAIADCEPCSGTRFHIEGNNLVCNSCGTTWSLDDLQGISGGCTQYPPDLKPYKVEGNQLQIDRNDIKDWKPRV